MQRLEELAYGKEPGCATARMLRTLIDELRAIAGRKIAKTRFGYEVLPADPQSVACGDRPLASEPQPLPPGTQPGVRRGRIKPGIRSEASRSKNFVRTAGATGKSNKTPPTS